MMKTSKRFMINGMEVKGTMGVSYRDGIIMTREEDFSEYHKGMVNWYEFAIHKMIQIIGQYESGFKIDDLNITRESLDEFVNRERIPDALMKWIEEKKAQVDFPGQLLSDAE